MRKVILYLFFGFSINFYTFASTINVLPETFPKTEKQGSINVEVVASQKNPINIEENEGYDVSFTNENPLFGELNIGLLNLPSGYHSDPLTVRVGFNVKSSMTIYPYAIGIKIEDGPKATDKLLDDAKPLMDADINTQLSMPTIFNIYYRAKAIAKSRMNVDYTKPSSRDLRTVNLYLILSRKLFEEQSLWPDEDVIKATDWMIQKHSLYPQHSNRILGSQELHNGNVVDNAILAVTNIRIVEGNYLQKLYDELIILNKKSPYSKENCKLFDSIQNYISKLSTDDVKYFSKNANKLEEQSLAAGSICTQKKLNEITTGEVSDRGAVEMILQDSSHQIQLLKNESGEAKSPRLSAHIKEIERAQKKISRSFRW